MNIEIQCEPLAIKMAILDPLSHLNVPVVQICEPLNPCTVTTNDNLAAYLIVSISGTIDPIMPMVPVTLNAGSTAIGG